MSSAPHSLRLERLERGAFVPVARPRISWQLPEGVRSVAGAELELMREGRAEIMPIAGEDRVRIPWPFSPLRSRARGALRARVSTEAGWSGWSEALAFEATLLEQDDWTARLIEPSDSAAVGDSAPVFGLDFEVDDVERARLYITAHGIYEAHINGVRVGDHHLAPGWTDYTSRLRFQSYDVTALLQEGRVNRVEATVGNGWYRGRLGWSGARALYGTSLGLLAQLEIERADGTRHTVVSGDHWRVKEGHTVSDDLYDGEFVDFRRTRTEARPVRYGTDVRGLLFADDMPPVRVTEQRDPVTVQATIGGAILVDFGQNFTGWVELSVDGHRGQEIEVRHAEVLIDGRLGTETLRSAKATDRYVHDGRGVRRLAPRFTFHGFRFAEISGIPIEQVHSIHGVVVGTDLRRTGWFSCSDPRLNKLHENIVRSAQSNFVDIPMDCPQRDERLGWTGDLQLFAPAASYLFDVAAMVESWLTDLRHEQHADGSLPSTVPDVLRDLISPGNSVTAGFSDAAVLVPEAAFRAYGDLEPLRQQWGSARRWIDRALAAASDEGIWEGGFQWGDWLDPSAPANDPSRSSTPVDLVATAALVRSLRAGLGLAKEVAPDDVEFLERELLRVSTAFVRRFVSPDGLLVGDSASAYVFALSLDALSEDQRIRAGERLVSLLRERGFRASTGFLGTPLILDALDSVGAGQIAMRLLLTDRSPSWLAQVRLGATTMWERWDSLNDDGKVNDAGMTSFNHYALGAVADWMHRRIGGIAPAAPGYRIVRIAPLLPPQLTYASTRLDTAYGPISVDWRREGGRIGFQVELPPGVHARVEVPGAPEQFDAGSHIFDVADPHPRSARQPFTTVADVLDDEAAGRELVAALVQLGAASDSDDAHRRLAPYTGLPVRELPHQIAHPAFLSGGPFIRDALRTRISAREAHNDLTTP